MSRVSSLYCKHWLRRNIFAPEEDEVTTEDGCRNEDNWCGLKEVLTSSSKKKWSHLFDLMLDGLFKKVTFDKGDGDDGDKMRWGQNI